MRLGAAFFLIFSLSACDGVKRLSEGPNSDPAITVVEADSGSADFATSGRDDHRNQLLLYRAPPKTRAYGDYKFKYSKNLMLFQDYVYETPAGSKGPHIVVLKSKRNFDCIEINMLRTSCDQYAACVLVENIPIGTNAADPAFLDYFHQVASSFRLK
jgi:hypothetical protein